MWDFWTCKFFHCAWTVRGSPLNRLYEITHTLRCAQSEYLRYYIFFTSASSINKMCKCLTAVGPFQNACFDYENALENISPLTITLALETALWPIWFDGSFDKAFLISTSGYSQSYNAMHGHIFVLLVHRTSVFWSFNTVPLTVIVLFPDWGI